MVLVCLSLYFQFLLFLLCLTTARFVVAFGLQR